MLRIVASMRHAFLYITVWTFESHMYTYQGGGTNKQKNNSEK